MEGSGAWKGHAEPDATACGAQRSLCRGAHQGAKEQWVPRARDVSARPRPAQVLVLHCESPPVCCPCLAEVVTDRGGSYTVTVHNLKAQYTRTL